MSDSATNNLRLEFGRQLVAGKRGRFQAGASSQTMALTTVSSTVASSASNTEGVVLQPQGIPRNGFSSAVVRVRE